MGISISVGCEDRMRKIEYCIIGGGVAGLAAANRLADLGMQPCVIEAGDYPKDRVCGEFLSPEILPTLSHWDIHPSRKIQTVKFFGPEGAQFEFKLDSPAGSMTHVDLEMKLLQRAKKKNVTILTNTRVLEVIPLSDQESSFEIQLSEDERIQVDQLLITVGSGLNQSKPKAVYYGKKAHYTAKEQTDTLQMHIFPGGYLGISPVTSSMINVAMLSTSPQMIPGSLLDQFPDSQLQSPCLECQLPQFGYRKFPNWKNVYFFGDAAMSIPPVTGDGVAMAISSGVMAAECSVKSDSSGFCRKSRKMFQKRILVGRILHHLLLNQYSAKVLFTLCSKFPGIAKFFYHRTRG